MLMPMLVVFASTAAFDPTAYLKLRETSPAAPLPVGTPGTTAQVEFRETDVEIEGKQYLRLQSAFGAVVLPRLAGVTAESLAQAVCTDALPPPSSQGLERAPSPASAALSGLVIATIEKRCAPVASLP